MTAMTVALVDEKDEAVRGETRTKVSRAVADLRRDMLRMTQWTVGTGLATLGAVMAMGNRHPGPSAVMPSGR